MIRLEETELGELLKSMNNKFLNSHFNSLGNVNVGLVDKDEICAEKPCLH